ncbi:GntR family transcriptional regulator [Amycolatopsis sp. NPDC004368]
MNAEGTARGVVLADRVYESVKAMVMDHEIEPGARIGIESVARKLDVSPTPVREALSRLVADGLVTKRAQAGYRATELLTAEGLSELFEMRLLLEPRAAALAAEHAQDTHLDRLEDVLERTRTSTQSGGRYADYGEFAQLDQTFHDTIAEAGGRRLLADAVERLHSHLHIFRLGGMAGAGRLTLGEHDRVLWAILRRNPDRAAEAMTEHLRSSQERLRRR